MGSFRSFLATLDGNRLFLDFLFVIRETGLYFLSASVDLILHIIRGTLQRAHFLMAALAFILVGISVDLDG